MAEPQITLYWFPISHPAQAARRMLEFKGLEYRSVTIPAGLQPILMRAYGFPGLTVPGLKIGDEKIQGTTAISRRLEQIKPDPPLFGKSDEDRDEIRSAEEWGERVLQDVPRHVFRWLGAHRSGAREAAARFVGARGALSGVAAVALLAPFRALSRIGGVTDEGVRRQLAELPANLDRVDELLAEGVLGKTSPNAADFQIATTIQAMLGLADLSPYVAGRPCEPYAVELAGGRPRYEIPAGIPAEWLPTDSRSATGDR